MRNFLKVLIIGLLSMSLLAACGDSNNNANQNNSNANSDNEKIKVVASFTLIEDIVKEIGGDFVETYNVVPIGTDPHEYDPLIEDIKATTDADMVIYNGMNLEGGEDGWFFSKLVGPSTQKDENIFEAAAGIEPMYLVSSDGKSKDVNPHVFLDPVNGIHMAENIHKALVQVDPDNKAAYDENAEKYIDQLKEVDKLYKEKIDALPEERRILVTSERAYQYMAQRYGLKEGYVWAIDTEEGGTPEQITNLINFIEENNPPVLFVESNVDTRPMETVSSETGVAIYKDDIFADELGHPGSEGDVYVEWLEYNINTIYEGLSE